MFNKILNDLSLASGIADQAFENITGGSYREDKSFIATLRAILLPRVGDSVIVTSFHKSTYGTDAFRNHPLARIVRATINDIGCGRLYIVDVSGSGQADRDAYFASLDDAENGFVKSFSTFSELDNIRDFVAEAMRIRVYTSETEHSTILFVEQLNLRKMHYLQFFIPRCFKWFFVDSPLTDEEKALLISLTKKSSEEYERLIEEFASKYDLRSRHIEAVLGDIEKNARRAQLENIDAEIDNARDHIEALLSQYSDYIKSLDNLNIRRCGLIEMINGASGSSDLVDYFKANKSLDLLGVSGHRFEFIVRTYLDSWDPEMYETISRRRESALFNGYRVGRSEFLDANVRLRFLNAIFGDDAKLRIKMCGYYRLDLRGSSTSERGYEYPRNCEDYMPNPHLQKYNCLGNHERLINQFLINGDNIAAVEQCIASAKSMNFAESQTYTYLLEKLFATDNKVIELPDHTSVSPVEALRWLDKEEHKDA